MTEEMIEKVRRELARYEHPLFDFDARPATDGVEVEIRYKPATSAETVDVQDYIFQLRPREIENTQFPWMFQKQLYDCLHDYIIEMFTRNPQRAN
jgi:hypothetical protein